jgi:phage terminase large subunit
MQIIVNHSTYKHNYFIDQGEYYNKLKIAYGHNHELLQSIADGKLGAASNEVIYGHFKPIEKIPDDCLRIIYGIDYGYTNDPTALVKVGVKPGQRFVKELCYTSGLSPEEIKTILKDAGYKDEDLYSEHDTTMIAQLRRLGLRAMPARKGPGSIQAGNNKVRKLDCYYTTDSPNLKDEITNYKFMTVTDSQTGKEVVTNVPIDGNDHCCNALTYAIFTDSFRRND